MASEAAAEAIRYDREIWYPLVCRLLQTFFDDGTEDRDSLFLESLQRREGVNELSLDQAKWLLDIKFRRTLIGKYRGISINTLVKECFESSHLLVDELLIERIRKFHQARVEFLRGGQAIQLYKIWINLEPDF